jgi:tRNA A37 threonylcarbamoyladenosine dehydratase
MSFERMLNLIGPEGAAKLAAAKVAVFGLGGVGSFAAEGLARAGIGTLVLVDADTVAESNLNRQLIALKSTVGRKKAEVMRERILDINPSAAVTAFDVFFDADTRELFDFSLYDYVADCIDTITSKLLLIKASAECGTPIISSMGMGNRLKPELIKYADIRGTKICPVAKIMRRELKRLGIEKLDVVYSEEEPLRPLAQAAENGRHPPASISFVPPVAGMMMAAKNVNAILAKSRG